MECCGGKGKPTPISRSRYVIGSVLLLGYHGAIGLALESAALIKPRFRPAAQFHRAYLSDLIHAIHKRDRIVLIGEQRDDA